MILKDEEETRALGAALAQVVRPGDVIALSGNLGVGKSMLARGLLRALGHEGDVPSPSFSIVQPYETLDPPVWHADLYRIEDASEMQELGFDAASDCVLIVEWPERAGERYWPEALSLRLDFAADGARSLTAQVPPAWGGRWPPQ